MRHVLCIGMYKSALLPVFFFIPQIVKRTKKAKKMSSTYSCSLQALPQIVFQCIQFETASPRLQGGGGRDGRTADYLLLSVLQEKV